MSSTIAPTDERQRQETLVAALAKPGALAGDGLAAQTIETHISWVLVAGPLAYKIKKAVRLPFLDFTGLERRRAACEEEVRLNRRTAPSLYLGVAAIRGTPERPVPDGEGEAIEYAVRMRAFAPDALLCDRVERGLLTAGDIDELARVVAELHADAAVAQPEGPLGRAGDALADALGNFAELRRLAASDDELERLGRLETWTLSEHAARRRLFDARRDGGRVRECHGDLHLGNVALVDGRITPFDCIEFSERMRWTDVMSDVAFLAMDLRERGREGLAHRFVNAYLEATGDYEGAPLLPLYEVYRALVRAKVSALRAAQLPAGPQRERERLHALRCVGVAEVASRRRSGAIVATHGPSGSGKTTTTQALLERVGAIRIRTDVERKRLFAGNGAATGRDALTADLYAPSSTRITYERIAALAEALAAEGVPAIVDGTLLQRWQRDLVRSHARRAGVRFVLLDFQGDAAALRARVTARAREARDASDADAAVLDRQLAAREPLGDDEVAASIRVDADASVATQIRSPGLARLVAALAD